MLVEEILLLVSIFDGLLESYLDRELFFLSLLFMMVKKTHDQILDYYNIHYDKWTWEW